MNRRSYLQRAGVAATAGLLAGCSGPGASDEALGTLAASVSDQPADIEDFESCIVTIAGIWVASADGDGSATEATESTGTEDGDRRYIEFEESQTADLVDLQGEASQSLGEWELEVGSYEYLQLDVTGVDGTLDDGSQADVRTPGNAPLQFNTTFEIRENQRTHFTADFTPVRQGNTGRYIIQPVASETTVTYGTEANDGTASEGDDTATESDGTATDGDDTATATS